MNFHFAQFGGPSFGGPPPIFMIIFGAIAVLVLGSILIKAGQGISEWSANNAKPVETEVAALVAKRTEVSGGKNSTSTTYYATFELADGERGELEVSGSEYGKLAEGDRGQLTHQGTRYLGFVRQTDAQPAPSLCQSALPNLACEYCGSAIPGGQIKCASCGWTWKPVSGTQSKL